MTRPAHRTGFHSLRAGGLDWDSLPLRLYAKGNRRSPRPPSGPAVPVASSASR